MADNSTYDAAQWASGTGGLTQQQLQALWDQAGEANAFNNQGSASWDDVASGGRAANSRWTPDGDSVRENDYYVQQNPDGTFGTVPIMRHGWNAETVKLMAMVALPAIAGAYGQAAGAGTEGLSGMDLAADAGINSGNNLYNAAGQFGGGTAGGLSGMDLAADAGAGSGNNVYTAAEGLGGASAAGGAGGAGGGGAGSGSGEAAYGWNPEGYTGGTPSLAGGGFGGAGNMGGTSTGFLGMGGGDWLQLGGSLLNGYLGQQAANKAADAQIGATREGNALLKYMYDTTRSDNMPALNARNNGLSGYQNLLKNPSSITSDPGYQFGLNEGNRSISNQQAAKGGYYSGATMKALTKYGQDYAGTKFDQALNRQGNLAGLGQVGSAQIGQAAQNYGTQASQNLIGAGNARGAASMAGSNAWQNALNGFLGYQQYKNLYGG